MELMIRPQDRQKFIALSKELRLIFLRNGASLYRVNEIVGHPGAFRTQLRVNSWAEYLRQYARMANAETELVERVQVMHSGEQKPVVVYSFGSTPQRVRGWLGLRSPKRRIC